MIFQDNPCLLLSIFSSNILSLNAMSVNVLIVGRGAVEYVVGICDIVECDFAECYVAEHDIVERAFFGT